MLIPTPLQSDNLTTLNGLILIDKPAGMTSHDVVDRVRKIAHTKRVGHAGTLDPFATGLLIIGINKGTKMLTNLVGLDKTYEATAILGATSATEDRDGEITKVEFGKDVILNSSLNSKFEIRNSIPPNQEEIEAILGRFRGGYLQTASLYSAKKIGGKKLYELARKGKMEGIEIPKKEVKISRLEMTSYAWPNLSFVVDCSSGTYIRALTRDIGDALGCGAYLDALRRTRIGNFDIANATLLDHLDENTLTQNILTSL